MQNKLKGWIVPNSVTKDPNDKILILDAAGNVGLEQVYKEMREEDTGLRQETLVHVVSLYERIIARFLMNGYNVNTGLFYAVPRFTGLIEGGRWNPEKTVFMYPSIRIKYCGKKLPKPRWLYKVRKMMSCISWKQKTRKPN